MDKVAVALERGLQSWCSQPGAFTAARNGGAESVLRNAVQGELEVEFACLGFSEACGARVDCALMAPDGALVCFEFKHGMLHRDQVASIEGVSADAIAQLTKVEGASRYYVHFVHALVCDDPKVGFAKEHNSKVVTTYKRFQQQSELEALLASVGKNLGPAWLEIPIKQDRFPGVRATLYCWAFAVDEAGHKHPLPTI